MIFGAFLMAQQYKELTCSAADVRDMGSIPGLGRAPREGMATHSSILAWRIPWIEEPGRLQSMGLQKVRHDWSDLACIHIALKKQNHLPQFSLVSWVVVTSMDSGIKVPGPDFWLSLASYSHAGEIYFFCIPSWFICKPGVIMVLTFLHWL